MATPNDSFGKNLGHYLGLIVLAMICLAPIWVMVATSFKDDVIVQDAKPLWFFFAPTFDNYEYILTRGKFDRYLTNSIIVGGVSTLLTLFIGGLCAYALARTEFKGRRLVANSTLLIRMVPPAVLAVPAFAMVTAFGIDSDRAVLIFFYTALNLPFTIWLLFGF
ncbi:MAG: carbohydrate ABC transporter permease, partial [Pseudomonadales bacterium]